MQKLTDYELNNLNGGAFNISVALLIGVAVTFIAGIFEGIVNPLSCESD